MPRTCPTFLHVQCFTNIDSDQLSQDDLKDNVILALEAAGNQTEAKGIYEDWREAAIRDRSFSEHTFHEGEAAA